MGIVKVTEGAAVTWYRTNLPARSIFHHHSMTTFPPEGSAVGSTLYSYDVEGVDLLLAERGIDPDRERHPPALLDLIEEAAKEDDEESRRFLVGLVACAHGAPRIQIEDLTERNTITHLPTGGTITILSDYQSKWTPMRHVTRTPAPST